MHAAGVETCGAVERNSQVGYKPKPSLSSWRGAARGTQGMKWWRAGAAVCEQLGRKTSRFVPPEECTSNTWKSNEWFCSCFRAFLRDAVYLPSRAQIA